MCVFVRGRCKGCLNDDQVRIDVLLSIRPDVTGVSAADRPLPLGALGAGAGAATAVTLPASRSEDDLIGETKNIHVLVEQCDLLEVSD